MCTATPSNRALAESGTAISVSPSVVSSAAASPTLARVMVPLASPAVAEIVVVPIAVPPVTTPVLETLATSWLAVAQVTVALRTTWPRLSITTAVACTSCPAVRDESDTESSMLEARCPFLWAFAARPSAERGSRALEDSQDTRRNAWSPKSTGAMARYERWGGRIESETFRSCDERAREYTSLRRERRDHVALSVLGGSVDAVRQTSRTSGDRVSASVGADNSWRANNALCRTSQL